METWQKNMDVLATGYFLPAREAYRAMLRQGLGGSMVFIGSAVLQGSRIWQGSWRQERADAYGLAEDEIDPGPAPMRRRDQRCPLVIRRP